MRRRRSRGGAAYGRGGGLGWSRSSSSETRIECQRSQTATCAGARATRFGPLSAAEIIRANP
jgi:hypothetical protein